MYPRSARFDTAIHDSHTVIVKAELWSAGLLNKISADLAVVGGEISVDRSAAVRRSGRVEIVDEDGTLVPKIGPTGRSGVEPYGSEMVIYRGIEYPDLSQELLPLGVFPISETEIDAQAGTTVTLSITDRSRVVSEALLTTPYYIAAGTLYTTAASDLVDACLPYPTPVEKLISATSTQTNAQTIVFLENADPWNNVQQLCRVIGAEAYFDPTGKLVIADVQDPRIDPPAFRYADDEASMILSAKRTLSRGPNAVIVSGESPGQKYRSMAVDDDPASPSYYFGGYGRKPQFFTDPLVTSQAAADASASARLFKQLGLSEVISISAIPHPAHDAGDIIHARLSVVGGA